MPDDTVQDLPIDLDTLTDDEVMNLNPEQIQDLQNQENAEEGLVDDTPTEVTENTDSEISEEDTKPDIEVPQGEFSEDSTKEDPKEKSAIPDVTKEPEVTTEEDDPKTERKEPAQVKPEEKSTEVEEKDEIVEEKDKPKGDAITQVAVDFFTKITKPFMADGKETTIRTPEDAIRLMQMGVNYSRRMEEMKPLRAINSMLTQHGLTDPDKLNELIDISKGNPEAIRKLLKDNNIDPLDIDVSKDTTYRATNYQMDPKDQTFQEAIERTMNQEGGSDLIRDMNSNWDEVSKEALRDQPDIFDNLLEQRRSGVYAQINKELEYQKNLGYLSNVSFLQGYHQVGAAMQKAGVWGKQNEDQSNGMAPIASKPIDTGPRKAALKPETQQPNPNLSSTTQPRITNPNSDTNQDEPDYTAMSDDEFKKLAPPG